MPPSHQVTINSPPNCTMANKLLNAGADKSATDRRGSTPLKCLKAAIKEAKDFERMFSMNKPPGSDARERAAYKDLEKALKP